MSGTSISAATRIPITVEKRFKSISLDVAYAKYFLKPEHEANNMTKGVPMNHMIERFDRILRIIQRYFTCEGRFNTLYQYHIRVLLHYIGKIEMNIP